MSSSTHRPSSFKVYVRWRPLSTSDLSTQEFERTVTQHETAQSISISSGPGSNRARTWNSGASFAQVFPETVTNIHIFENVVGPVLPQVLEGDTCNFFAYGHSGSGKTHTIIGYNYEERQHLGLCFSAAQDLFQALAKLNTELRLLKTTGYKEGLGVAVRLYEVRGKCAYDLFNDGIECHVREGPDGQTHIRGQTEALEGGKLRVRPIVAMPCWSYEELRTTVLAGLQRRKTGLSSVHDESSRTHAVLELEVINKALLEAREAVTERESELVPVGKRATDVYLEEHGKALIRTPEGNYIPNPAYTLNQQRIDAAEAEKKEYEARLKSTEDVVTQCFETR